jgi:hypothetical protein
MDRLREMGVTDYSIHGLRKNAGNEIAEAGGRISALPPGVATLSRQPRNVDAVCCSRSGFSKSRHFAVQPMAPIADFKRVFPNAALNPYDGLSLASGAMQAGRIPSVSPGSVRRIDHWRLELCERSAVGSKNRRKRRKNMHPKFRKLVIATATAIAVAGTTVALPGSAEARWRGGGWGWGWGGFGIGLGTGLLLATAARPYYGGYYGYGYPAYGYAYPAYGYGYGYPAYGYGYGYPAAYGYGYRRAYYGGYYPRYRYAGYPYRRAYYGYAGYPYR